MRFSIFLRFDLLTNTRSAFCNSSCEAFPATLAVILLISFSCISSFVLRSFSSCHCERSCSISSCSRSFSCSTSSVDFSVNIKLFSRSASSVILSCSRSNWRHTSRAASLSSSFISSFIVFVVWFLICEWTAKISKIPLISSSPQELFFIKKT